MIGKTPKTFNARFDKEVMWAIADLIAKKYGRDKTEAVDRAIMEAHSRLNFVGDAAHSPTAMTVVMSAGNNIPAVNNCVPPPVRGFPITCRHCGDSEARGATKFASICFGCKTDGHSNLPAECPVCTAGQSI